MKSVFGPVPSGRLGRSLGVDPLPFKTCNLSCVYCQLGRTRRGLLRRIESPPPEAIVEDVERELALLGRSTIDWITLVGAGEPTLHSGIGQVIRGIKRHTEIPVAVITNGSLLDREDVREDLRSADAVLPSIDAGSERLYRTINRPIGRGSLESQLTGLSDFRRTYRGTILAEVMIVGGLNDTDEAIADLATALERVAPDELYIGVPTRPPAEAWVQPPSAERLEYIVATLSRIAPIAAAAAPDPMTRRAGDLVASLHGIVTRHPMTLRELCSVARGHRSTDVREALGELRRQGKVGEVHRFGRCFFHHADARYGYAASPDEVRPGGVGRVLEFP